MVKSSGGLAQTKCQSPSLHYQEYPEAGGSNYEGNGKGKRKGQTQSQQEKKVKEHFVYHYSNGIPSLAEQIVLGNKSLFLQIDIENDYKPVVSPYLDLKDDQGLIIYPHEDGVSGVASYIEPIKFKSMEDIKSYISAARKETIDSIFDKHLSLWNQFVASNDKHMITFLAIDSVYSQFQDLFEATHYDLITGPPGSGKNVILVTFKLLGYRVVLVGEISGANILDLYGSAEKCQVTVVEDELDDIEKDAIKRKIYKMGYDLTGNTTRTLDGNTSNRTNRLYKIFGFKVFGTESPPEDKGFEGFNDRTFVLQSRKGKKKLRVKKALLEMGKPLDRQDSKYKDIIKEIDDVRKITFIFRMLHYADIIEEVETNIDGRPLELTGAQINLFASDKLGSNYWSVPKEDRKNTLLEKTILPTLSEFLRRKGQLAEKTIEGVLYQALNNLMQKEVTDDFKIIYDDIYDEVKRLTDATDSIMPNEHAIYSVEYGKLTHKRIISRCRRVFDGKDDKIYKTMGEGNDAKQVQFRALRFDKMDIEQQGKSYEIINAIEILDPSDSDSDSDPDEEGTDKTERRKYDQKTNTSNNDEKDQYNRQSDRLKDSFNNNTSEEDNIQDIDDSNLDIQDTTNEEEASKPVDNESIKDSTYTRTAQISVLQSCNNTDPDVIKTSEYLKNLQEAANKSRKSKVAEAAEANISGNGIMGERV
jgi:hypothetical protein